MDPEEFAATKHAASLREAFVQHMGGEIVDASLLKWPR